jgi:hypothetical protein
VHVADRLFGFFVSFALTATQCCTVQENLFVDVKI